ncbi:NAD(P)-dependent dehydrogenase (short-subunit alcohol dehydrogenase family) [Bradyrhizobium elkanii]
MKQVIVVTGASSGFGRLTANALARAGHTVYASMRHTTGRNAAAVADIEEFAHDNKVDLRALELDVGSQASVDAAIAQKRVSAPMQPRGRSRAVDPSRRASRSSG